MSSKQLCKILALMLSIFVIPFSQAHHANGHPTRYVAENGIDDGSCLSAKKPCKSIIYAFTQSGKGDKIRVAEGSYVIHESEIFLLLSDMIIVRGSYSTKNGFTKTNETLLTSNLLGVPAEYSEQLAKSGFKVIQDKKGQYKLDAKTYNELSIYKRIRTKKQVTANCINGMAGQFPCNNIDLKSHMGVSIFQSSPASVNDVWGFVDLNDNREYAILGTSNSTTVIDVTDPVNPQEIGYIAGSTSIWRDVKVYQYFDDNAQKYKAYAYVTTEANQGLQVIDLTGLPNSISLANTLTGFSSAHNVYLANVDYSTGMSNETIAPSLYIAGANSNGGAYRILGLSDPVSPSLLLAPPAGTGYMHDATGLVITDSRTSQCAEGHNPCELLIDFNASTVDIWDVTNKAAPVKLSSTGYANAGYVHSGWWSQDKKYIFIQDESDEILYGLNTTLRVLDINDLINPSIVGEYVGPTRASDHNGFTLGNQYFMSNYNRGLTVLDIEDPSVPTEIAFFDTYPAPAANNAENEGAWGTYPYLPSGNILVSDYTYGFFVLSLQSINNIKPIITAAQQLTINRNQPLALSLDHLIVTDNDNNYPDDFTLIIIPGGNYTVNGLVITPFTGFVGALNVAVMVNDGIINSDSFNLSVTVESFNTIPTAVNDSYTLVENSGLTTFNVLYNDVDGDNDTLSIQGITYTGQGSVSFSSTNISYTPANNFIGGESIQYEISDGNGGAANAQVNVSVTAAQSSSGSGSFSWWLMLILIVLLVASKVRFLDKSDLSISMS